MTVHESRTRRCLDCFCSRSPFPSQVASETLAGQAESRINLAWKDKKAVTTTSTYAVAQKGTDTEMQAVVVLPASATHDKRA